MFAYYRHTYNGSRYSVIVISQQAIKQKKAFYFLTILHTYIHTYIRMTAYYRLQEIHETNPTTLKRLSPYFPPETYHTNN